MKVFSLIFFVLIIIPSIQAQKTTAQLLKEAKEYLHEGNYPKGLTLAQEALKIVELQNNIADEERYPYIYTVGKAYAALEQTNQALPFLEKALAISERIDNFDISQKGSLYATLSLCYAGIGQLDKVLIYNEQQLRVAKENFGTNSPQYAHAMEKNGQYWYYLTLKNRKVSSQRIEAQFGRNYLKCKKK